MRRREFITAARRRVRRGRSRRGRSKASAYADSACLWPPPPVMQK